MQHRSDACGDVRLFLFLFLFLREQNAGADMCAFCVQSKQRLVKVSACP
jgi:hypothetical protein